VSNDVQEDLIFDLGLHRGEDTEFYLSKGFRVVAVDANADLCAQAIDRLSDQVRSGALTVVNKAISDKAGEIDFYEDESSSWSTVDVAWAARNRRLGSRQHTRTVTAFTTADLLSEFGAPYYMKVDIEGMDMTALRGLAATDLRPRYVSIESDKVSFRGLRNEFDTFASLGYDKFKPVSQRDVPKQTLPNPAREGSYVDHRFALGSSGAFGDEAPGQWISADDAIERYRRAFLQYALTGDDPFVRSVALRNALKVVGFRNNWFDTHARLSSF
jgi:FkbM family methyltransferase